MTETTSILILAVITILTILLTVIGIQVVYILKEFRRTMEKVNKILDDAGVASESMAKSISGITGLTAGLKAVLSLLGLFKKEKNNE